MSARPSHVQGHEISEERWAWREDFRYEQGSIFAVVREIAESLPEGAVVLDVNGADAPHWGLFEHCEYLTTDWGGEVTGQSREADFVASPDALPVTDASVDAVLLTDVLDRTPEPEATLRDAARVLRPGGEVFATVPFLRALEDTRMDLWRFTPTSLERLLLEAGFVAIRVEPLSDCFTAVAQLLRSLGSAMGRTADGRDGERDEAAKLLVQLAERLAALHSLDAAGRMPLGWIARARRS